MSNAITTATTTTTATATTLAPTVGGFLAPLNKKGKVTMSAARAAAGLNLASEAALMGVAMTGRGTAKKLALAHVTRDAVTVPRLIARPLTGNPRIDGRALSDMLALLAGLYPASFTGQLRGEAGIGQVLDTACKQAEVAVDLSLDKSDKAFARAVSARAAVEELRSSIFAWLDAGAVAGVEYRAAQTADAQTADAQTADAQTADA